MVWRRKEMFYLMTHSTHFIYGYMASDMVKDHSDSEKGNPLPPHRLLFLMGSARVLLYAPSHRQDSTYHGLCYTSRGALAGSFTKASLLIRTRLIGHLPTQSRLGGGDVWRPLSPIAAVYLAHSVWTRTVGWTIRTMRRSSRPKKLEAQKI